MQAIIKVWLGVYVAFGSAAINVLHAEPATFSDPAKFYASLQGVPTILDFDQLPAGTTITANSAAEGITFIYDFNGLPMQVSHLYATTSAPNFLGTSDGGMFHDGDDFTMSFAPVTAIGLFFITADPLLDGDLKMVAGGATALLKALDVQETLPDGSKVYFLGVIDNEAVFSSADVEALPGGFFLYNVDDIVTAPANPPRRVAEGRSDLK